MWPGLGWLRSTAAAGGGVGWNGRGVYGGCQLPAGAGRGRAGRGRSQKLGDERERGGESRLRKLRGVRGWLAAAAAAHVRRLAGC